MRLRSRSKKDRATDDEEEREYSAGGNTRSTNTTNTSHFSTASDNDKASENVVLVTDGVETLTKSAAALPLSLTSLITFVETTRPKRPRLSMMDSLKLHVLSVSQRPKRFVVDYVTWLKKSCLNSSMLKGAWRPRLSKYGICGKTRDCYYYCRA